MRKKKRDSEKRGIRIDSATDLNAPEFISDVMEQFERTRQQIDAVLERQAR